jgi:hypothetical protein
MTDLDYDPMEELFNRIEDFGKWTPEYTTSEHGLTITVTQPEDPAYALLLDDRVTVPNKSIHRNDCYICEDPEFARMGLPLCHACYDCGGHVPADDIYCWDCNADQREGRNHYYGDGSR